ncbi:MAG: hypothetical protein WC683_14135 [bacterium]
MTAIRDAIKVILEADTGAGGFATVLTGGVYDWDETGRLGISRENTATSTAFDANKRLKPCALIRTRSQEPDGFIADPTPVRSIIETVELWLYQVDGYETIEDAEARAFTLLDQQRASNHTLRYNGVIRAYDDPLDAFVLRATYTARYIRT